MSAYLSVSGFDCHRGRLLLPRVGVWVADLVVDPESGGGSLPAIGSPVVVGLDNNQVTFKGTVRRANNVFGTALMRVVGGGGGFPTNLAAKAFQGVTAQQVISDLLTRMGEIGISTQSEQAILQTPLDFWSQIGGPGFVAWSQLMQELGVGGWRVQPDGSIWLGTETYPINSLANSGFTLMSYAPQELKALIDIEGVPSLFPGQGFMGGQVSAVEHILDHDKTEMYVLFEDAQLEQLAAEAA